MRIAVGMGLLLALAVMARAGEDAPAPPPVAQYEGRTAAEWTVALASDDVKLRQKAAYALFQLGKDAAPAAAGLVKSLRDADAYVRTTSAKALPRLPAGAVKPLVPELAADLFVESQDVRREAGSVLWRLGPLAAVLEKDAASPTVAFSLCALDAPAAPKALAKLVAMAGREERLVDVLGAFLLLGPKSATAVPAIVTRLTHADAKVRSISATALDAIGPAAKDALPALDELKTDPDPNVVAAAKQAAETIRAAPAAPK
jgi:HEAT repeat protein